MAFVLVADGDTTCAERAAGALIAAGHACSWVRNEQQVRALMRWRQPDLIVLDEDMPDGADGSLLHALRSNEECRNIPIVLLKTPNETDGSLNGKHWEPETGLRKPCDPRLVVWSVNHALEVQQALPKRARIRAWLARKHAAARDHSIA